jgi:Cys-tRNA(Pro)/Cys-tRNA(Cys) deacylase
MVFKTIVVVRHARGKSILAVVPGPTEVDLKALAKLLGEKKVFIASEREAEKLTGLLAGGISPLALLNRGFQVVMDDNALKFDRICISGGERGLMVALAPAAVIDLTSAITGKITPN